MKLLKFALVGAAVAAAGAAVAQERDRDAEANSAFTTYPRDSLANGEQGTVRYKVKIDRRGRARECEVTVSSGFERLDLATCEMLMERARFTPNRDGGGKARGSVYEGRVVWRLS